jgi:archaellum component FlaC
MKPSQIDTVIAMLKDMKSSTQATLGAQDKKIDQVTQFIVAHSTELNELTNLLRNYIEATSDVARRVARLEEDRDDPHPGYHNGNGGP